MNNWKIILYSLLLILTIGLIVPIQTLGDNQVNGISNGDSIIDLNEKATQKKLGDPLQMDFFYDDDCESCQKVLPYIDTLKTAYPEIQFNYHNICNEVPEGKQNQNLLTKFKNERGLSKAYVPVVFSASSSVQGDKNITVELEPMILANLGKIGDERRVPLPIATSSPPMQSGTQKGIDFFYDDDCESCQKVLPVIDKLKATYSGIQFNYHNICNEVPEGKQNQNLLTEFKLKRRLSQAQIPIVFIGDTTIQGEKKLLNDLEPAVKKLQNTNNSGNLSLTKNERGEFLFPILLLGAIGEGINPFVLVLFALLLVPVVPSSSRRQLVTIGIAGILGYLCTRLIIGIGIVSWVSYLDIAKVVIPIGAIIALIIGAVHIRDGISKTEKPLFTIPHSMREKIDPYLKAGTASAAGIGGIFLGFLSLIGSGGIYLPVLGIISPDMKSGALYLFWYNLAVIIPVVLMVLLAVIHPSPKKWVRFVQKNQSILRLVMGISMVLTGILFLLPKIV